MHEEPVAARAAAFAFEPIEIAEIGVDRVDRRDIGGRRGEQALGVGDLIGKGPDAVRSLLSVAPSAAEGSSAPQVSATSRGCADA
jgi:hypothetical protein